MAEIGWHLIFWSFHWVFTLFSSQPNKWRAVWTPFLSVRILVLVKCCSPEVDIKSFFLYTLFCVVFLLMASLLSLLLFLVFIAINKLIHLFIYHPIYWLLLLLPSIASIVSVIIIRTFGSKFCINFVYCFWLALVWSEI